MTPSRMRLQHLLAAVPTLATQPEWRPGNDAPWFRHGHLSFPALLSILIDPVLDRAMVCQDRAALEHLLAHVDLLADSPRDIALVNERRVRIAQAMPGISPHIIFPRPRHLWVTDRPNLLAPDTLNRVRDILAHPDVVFGYHDFFYGGSAPDLVAWSGFATFLAAVTPARPGDRFELWSVEELLAKGLTIVAMRGPDDRVERVEHAAMVIAAYLVESHDEVVVVWWQHSGAPGRAATCGAWMEWKQVSDTFVCDANAILSRDGAIYAFRLADLERQDATGFVHVLVRAKVPNERGEVPIGGAY